MNTPPPLSATLHGQNYDDCPLLHILHLLHLLHGLELTIIRAYPSPNELRALPKKYTYIGRDLQRDAEAEVCILFTVVL